LNSCLFFNYFLAWVFEGHDVTIQLDRNYYIDFACDFKLQDYPFDTQVIILILKLNKYFIVKYIFIGRNC
jgi:hypothetical protein